MAISSSKSGNPGGLGKRHAGSPGNNLCSAPMYMAICVVVGFVLGLVASNVELMGTTLLSPSGSSIVPKEQGSNFSVVGTTTASFHGGPAPGLSPIAEEVLPPTLHEAYAPQNLQFNVTRSMLRQSRPVVGNTQRLHSYLKKLRSRTCTTVLFLGGSVTAGHNGGGPSKAYPSRWMEWLNERYPCLAANGTSGKHEHIVPVGPVDSLSFFSFFDTVSSVEKFDLVFTEFNVNDNFVSGVSHTLEDKGSAMDMHGYASCWYFEVLLRRLLLLRKPDPVAVVTFNADYIGRMWAFPPYFQPSDARKLLFRGNQEPLKIWVSSMYEVPVFSAVIWMLPLAGKKGLMWQFNRTENPYNTGAWHADACCHPKPPGHMLLSLVLAYCIHEEEQMMLSYKEQDTAKGQQDFTADVSPILREPLYLSPEEDSVYVQGKLTYGGFDFTDPQKQKSWEGKIVANEGWTWYADNRDKDKYGFIANSTSGGEHIAISLTGGDHGSIEILYVVSYENFGISIVWLDDSIENVHKEGLCDKEVKAKPPPTPQHLVAIWDMKASVPKVELMTKDKLDKGEEKILHICLTPRSDGRQGDGNKFKLLGVRVF